MSLLSKECQSDSKTTSQSDSKTTSQSDHRKTCGLFWWPNLPKFTSLWSPSSLSVTWLGAPLSNSLLKRQALYKSPEWMNEKPVSQIVGKISQSDSKTTSQLVIVRQPVSQLVRQPVSQIVIQSVSQIVRQPEWPQIARHTEEGQWDTYR